MRRTNLIRLLIGSAATAALALTVMADRPSADHGGDKGGPRRAKNVILFIGDGWASPPSPRPASTRWASPAR
ncbi:MAG: hypothetical protein R2712_08200 [Vicinamibacterales bacterium]